MQEPERAGEDPAEYRTAPECTDRLTMQPVLRLTGWGAGLEGQPHPHPEWSSGFCFPKDSPGPVPVTEDAAISSPKKSGASMPLTASLHMYVQVGGSKCTDVLSNVLVLSPIVSSAFSSEAHLRSTRTTACPLCPSSRSVGTSRRGRGTGGRRTRAEA